MNSFVSKLSFIIDYGGDFIINEPPVTDGLSFNGRGRRIRTYEVTESESVALPLGDTPV